MLCALRALEMTVANTLWNRVAPLDSVPGPLRTGIAGAQSDAPTADCRDLLGILAYPPGVGVHHKSVRAHVSHEGLIQHVRQLHG